ncbi:MAG: 4-hydroxythreonine-4-phosphate dehydrogenase PdxA [Bacteroidetes bacterium]|nr:MAG: 4-hydroxythreonine-4-phosphate dehydrogenase PdxA [Bacteroidota bacterium]
MSKEHIRVGISIGDFNGIGVEVALKAISNPALYNFCTPILYGSPKVISYYKKQLGLHDLSLHYCKSATEAHDKKANLVVCWEEETEITPGTPSAMAGDYAFKALERAAADAEAGHLQVLVTAPLDKSTVNTDARPFKGHTEYLASVSGTSHLMTLVSDDLRVALVTGHVPVSEVAPLIKQDRVYAKIVEFAASLKKDFGISKPRIAVLGLNPHAGDSGLLGSEDKKEILAAVEQAREENYMSFGPYPADGFFGSGQYHQFDGVLAMYHDQGLIPFKMLGFEDGVNFTASLNFVRTSPDHGTAYNIAGKGEASEMSLRNAIYLGIDIYKRRHMDSQLEETLAFTPLKRERFRMDF